MMVFGRVAVSVTSMLTAGLGGGEHRLDDVVVAGAAAQVALQADAHLGLGGVGLLGEQAGRRHDHPRRAVAALQPVVLHERLLHRVQLAVGGEALDREDVGAVGLDGEHRAALHRLAVDVDGARAARRRVAADVRAGQLELLAQELHEQRPRLDVAGAGGTVDRE